MASPILSTSNSGIFGISPGTGTDRGYSVAVQADGKVLLTGYSWNGEEDDFTTIRFNVNGRLDKSFADKGIARTSIFTVNDENNTDNGEHKDQVIGDDRAYQVIIDSDQKILIAGLGYDSNSQYYMTIVRYLSNGQVDTDFGDNGIFKSLRTTNNQTLWQITEASDKGYYLHGDTSTAKDIFKLTNNGSLDPLFGNSGKLDLAQDSVISSDSQIYESSMSEVFLTNTPTVEIAKYNSDGALDTGFGATGTLSLSFTVDDSESTSLINPLIADAQYLYLSISNYTASFSSKFYIARIDISNQSLDTSYGSNGFVSISERADSKSVVFDNKGGLILGHRQSDFVVSRIDNAGVIDSTFGENGVSTIDLDNRRNYGWDIAFDKNSEKIYVGGNRYQSNNNNDYAIARLDTSGSLDTTFKKFANYTEGEASSLAEPEITIADNDSPTLASASITISENYTLGDSLLFVNDNSSMGNIEGVWDANTGILSLLSDSQSATVAEWQAALRSVAFTSSSDHPTENAANRTLDWSINDGSSDSSSITTNVNIFYLNDAPAGTDKTITISEDGSHTFDASDFGFSDTDGNNLKTVIIHSLPAAGALTLDGTAVSTNDSIAAADLTKLLFTPTADSNGNSYTSFSFKVQDDGGTGNSGVDTDPTANTIVVDVNAVNDAPAGTDKTITISEDGSHTFDASDFGFSDTDGNNLKTVIIHSLPAAGALTLDGTAVSTNDSIAAADLTKLLFTPTADSNGNSYTSFSFKVQDDGGTGNSGVDTDPTANTIFVDVNAVNDAPVLNAPTAGTITEDDGASGTIKSGLSGTLSATDADGDILTYGIADVTAIDRISTLVSTYGSLSLNTTSGKYTYTPNSSAIEVLDSGDTAADSFSVTASDGIETTTAIYFVNINGADDPEPKKYKLPKTKKTINGTNKDDILKGTGKSDLITGKNGNDKLNGSKGDDVLKGNVGKDNLKGGKGMDYPNGSNGRDVLVGGKGADVFQISKKTDLVEDFSIKQGDRIGLTSKGKYKIVDDADGVLIKASSKKKLLLEGVTYDKVIAAGIDLFVQPI